MKKLIFAGFAALLALSLLTCDGFSVPPVQAENDMPSVQYSADGSRVTLRINQGEARDNGNISRALTANLAKMGHDFFEVVFDDGAGNADSIARASWRRGEPVSINGVKPGNYGGLVAGSGNAILMVGRESDKTLLAIGALDSSTENIADATTSVTFEVSALLAGVSDDADESSFVTDFKDISPGDPKGLNTEISTASFGNKKFPLFMLRDGGKTVATYTIVGIPNNDARIKIKDESDIMLVEPRFYLGNGKYEYFAEAVVSPNPASPSTTIITNNNVKDDSIQAYIKFEFDMPSIAILGKDIGIFAFVFSIPVYAIDEADSITWYIEPGYGRNRNYLDEGLLEKSTLTAGAILVGIGEKAKDGISITISGP